MKKIFFFLFLLIANFSSKAQSMDKFIRIVGNSNYDVNATKIKFDVSILEIQPNEYRQVRYKSIEQVYSEVIAKFNTLGIQESNLKREITKSFGGYDNTKSSHYTLELDKNYDITKLVDFGVEGCKITNLQYVFDESNSSFDESSLASKALEDAKRKAENIAKSVGKKIGKILNIDGVSKGLTQDRYDSQKQMVKSQRYQINVTYELLDL